MRRFGVLAGVLAVGLMLRLHALSPYIFYPDGYQSLMVARNLQTAHRVVATMGPGGLLYPDLFGWTRPVYPALIALGSGLGLPAVAAARGVNVLAGLGAIVLAYFLGAHLLASRRAGLAAATLLAVSYGPVVWGGFVLTEALGILVLLLVIWQAARRHGLALGAVLALATLTRYEYAVLLLPSLVFAARPFSWTRAASIMGSYALLIALVLALIHPFAYGPAIALEQLGGLPLIALGLALAGGAGLFLSKMVKNHPVPYASTVLIAAPAGLFAAALTVLPSARGFLATDPLIAIAAVAGLTLMLRGPRYRALAVYLLVCAALLAVVYARVNPAMDRYWTHLIPFLLIPAAYAAVLARRRAAVVVLVLCFAIQAVISTVGLRAEPGNPWFRTGYEALAARRLAPLIPSNAVVVAALPEPYYLITGHATQSIADQPPYLFLSSATKDRPLYIVQDQAMRQLFPRFSALLDEKLQDSKITQFDVGTDFRYITQITPERQALIVYKTNQSALTAVIH